MADSRVYSEQRGNRPRSGAGIISRIRLENFMCHSCLQIEFGDFVNFITGQNGSGKSAILTALCVAFGARAKGTQRAATLKDFIKTGCSYASVLVEMKNRGEDAFKYEIYGDVIMVERRITESTSSIYLKDHQGKKVTHKRDELHELVEHFNIDVENPCVIMTQDKSREFLHSGSDKDKFKFFYKATLLQQVNELLEDIESNLTSANQLVGELELSIKPIVKELDELNEKIKNMERVEEIAQEMQLLKKKLAWSWVYDTDKEILEQTSKLEKLKDRIPICQDRIDKFSAMVDELNALLDARRSDIASLMEKTSEVTKSKDVLQQNLSAATKEKFELEEKRSREKNTIKRLSDRLKFLEQKRKEIHEQHTKSSQVEESIFIEQMERLKYEVDEAQKRIMRLLEEENALSESLLTTKSGFRNLCNEIEVNERRYRELCSQIEELKQRRVNKVTAFGGERVLALLRVIERCHRKFMSPPIGPIGAHVILNDSDQWGKAVDCAVGKLLDAFIVTNHADSLVLRACCREANYRNLQIVIYDFSRTRMSIPPQMLPSTDHPTTISVLRVENPTVFNVLVDMSGAERQVLVKDYEVGKSVAFDQRIQNLKEVYTSDGYRMFFRGSVQTTLPPYKRARTGRLCASVDEEISHRSNEASETKGCVVELKGKKRNFEESLQDLEGKLRSLKKQKVSEERTFLSKQNALREMKDAYACEKSDDPAPNDEELLHDISQVQEDIQGKESVLEKIQVKIDIADKTADERKKSLEEMCDLAKGDIDVIQIAENEVSRIEEELRSAEEKKVHYEDLMQQKVLADIKAIDTQCIKLQENRQEYYKKASVFCSESELGSLGDCAGSTPDQLTAQLSRLNQILQHESQRYTESIDDIRALYDKKKRRISKKQQTYSAFHEKLNACQKALSLRWSKFHRNATLLKRQLTWQFNGHLTKKGISGHIKVDYEKKVLTVEVKMPQDASANTVRDTRGLSGGERSFSTLCFALALHEMTESPFRAMDEFDVFMDAVSRKISLDTLVDFAEAQGSQWIFITPHDISMVKPGENVRKQQMAAPRG